MHRFVNESDRSVVDQARGVLMLRYGVGSRESLAVLDRWAQEAGVAVTTVASALVHGICLGRVDAETEVVVRWLEQRMRGDISDLRGEDEGAAGARAASAPGERTVLATVPAPTPSVPARQWRYSSAVHAARVLRSR